MNICFNAVQFPIFVFESDLGLSAIRSLIVGGGPAVTTGDEYTVRYVEQCNAREGNDCTGWETSGAWISPQTSNYGLGLLHCYAPQYQQQAESQLAATNIFQTFGPSE